MPRIDAHHHLWRFDAQEFGWIGDDRRSLRRNFLPDDLKTELASAHVDGTVVVQARQTVEETDWLLKVAAEESLIWGVVGWLPLAEPGIARLLDGYGGAAKLKGLRHVAEIEPAGFLDGDAFNAGVRLMRGRHLVYDLLIYPHQLPEAIRFADRHPEQPFALDHIAKPGIRGRELTAWATALGELAQRPHVTCKISGMITETDWAQWTPEELRPYFEVALNAFGPKRLMIGTDWPVLTVGCAYREWWKTVEEWIAPLDPQEQAAVLGETAIRVYSLRPPTPEMVSVERGSAR